MSATALTANATATNPAKRDFFISCSTSKQLLRWKSNFDFLVKSACPTGHLKHHQHVTMVNGAGRKFPIEQRHHRAGIELAMASRSKDFYFVSHSRLLINDETINALALITEMLRFHGILRIRCSQRVFFILRRDPHDFSGKARRQDREKQQREQNSKGRFHTLRNRKFVALWTCVSE